MTKSDHGVFSDKTTFGYVDSNGKIKVLMCTLQNNLQKILLGDENKVDFVLVEAASRVEYLESNKVDILLANSLL